MTTQAQNATPAVDITQIGRTGSTNKGFNSVIESTATRINNSASSINTAMENFDPTDPGALLKMQQQLANYNLAITVTSSLIKSLEDTVKSVAQKL